MKLAALFASRQAVEPPKPPPKPEPPVEPKPPPLEPTTPAAFGYRFPVRLDFDPTKLPERTRVAWGHIDRWRKLKSVSKQPDIAAMVAEPRFTLRMFRIFNIGVGVARAQALVGDPSGVLELAGVARKLVAKANTGYGPYVAELGDGLQPADLNRSRVQVGVRRYNTWTHGDDWLGFAGTDADHLDRCLSMGVIAGLYELLEGCAHVHADVAAAAAEVRELLCVDLAVRCAMWGRVNGGTIAKSGSPLRHAVTGFAYACRVIGERLSADPKLLGRAQALGAKHDTTVYAADFLKAYDDMGSWLVADDDVIKGPDGRNVLVFPHGVVGHYRANGKNNGIPGFHFTVYCAETVSSMFSDFLSGGKYTPRERMTQIGNTAANCIFIHGFDSGLLSDDMGGGGLQDPVEERLGGPAFREVRFRGGDRAQSRWHLTDRTSDIGDSRTHIAVTGRGQATLGMAFTDFPDRLEMINTADKRLGQEFRVGFDITRLLMAGIMDGVVKL